MKRYLKQFWKINLFIAVLLVLSIGIQVAKQFLIMDLLQKLLEQDVHGFVVMLLIIIAAELLRVLLSFLKSVLTASSVRKMNNQVRQDMGKMILNRSYQEFHAQQTGEYLSWFTNDISQIEALGWNSFFKMIEITIQILISALALAYVHWALLLLAIVTAGIMLLLPKLFEKRMEAEGKKYSDRQEKAVAHIKDALSGYDVLNSFGYKERFLQVILKESDRIEQQKYQLTFSQSKYSGIITVGNMVCQFAVIALIGILSLIGAIPVSVILGGGNLCGMLYNSLANIIQVQLSLSASKPYFEKIKYDEEVKEQGKQPLPDLHDRISLENISFRYGQKPILDGMDFTFEIGKKYALTGPSGCGKTTLLKILLGWLPDYTGTILLDGRDAKNYTAEQIRQQMSYIEQDVFLFNATIRENITLGESFDESELQKALYDSALAGDLASMPDGLDTVAGEEGRRLSGGQKQRVAIARALIHKRSILLIDEGTSALDQKNADIVEQSLLSNPAVTLILISHHLTEEGRQRFDRVYELEPAVSAAR